MTNQQLARAMHDLNRLVIKALHRHEPHRRPRHRLANSFGSARCQQMRFVQRWRSLALLQRRA
jgi:hypothetical protein